MTTFVPATKDLQRQWRSRLFFHLDGLALSGVVPVLDVSGVLEEVLQTGGDVDELASLFGANPGYLMWAYALLWVWACCGLTRCCGISVAVESGLQLPSAAAF